MAINGETATVEQPPESLLKLFMPAKQGDANPFRTKPKPSSPIEELKPPSLITPQGSYLPYGMLQYSYDHQMLPTMSHFGLQGYPQES